MAAKLEIILEDKSPAAAPVSPTTPVSPGGRPPSEVGGKKIDQSKLPGDLVGIVQDVASLLGMSGIAGAALKLVAAFMRLEGQVKSTQTTIGNAAAKEAKPDFSGVNAAAKEAKPDFDFDIPSTTIETVRTDEAGQGPFANPFGKPKPTNEYARFEESPANRIEERQPLRIEERQPLRIEERQPLRIGGPVADKPSAITAAVVSPKTVAPPAAIPAAAGTSALAAASVAVAAVSLVAVSLGALGYAISASVAKIKSLTDELESYSGAVAQAAGMSQLREELASIRRGQTIGPDLARVENLRSRAQDEAARIMDGFYSAILKMLVRNEAKIETVINVLSKIADYAVPMAEGVIKGIDIGTDIHPQIGQIKFAIMQVLKLLGHIDENTKDKEPEDDPMVDEWLKQFAQPALNGVGRPMVGGGP